jgi:hypothetical protein
MKSVIAVVVALVAWTAAADSQKQVFNNLANEFAECAAYFAVMSIAMENSAEPDQAEAWNKQRDRALEFAAIVTKQAGLKEETVGDRFNMAVQDMNKRIYKNTFNISILMADYNDRCIEVMTDPKKRAQYWIERLAAPHQ